VGAKHGTTDARGRATLLLAPGSYTARASAPGYASASARVTVPKKTG
jgi:Carboxypeptidase regulatory-like domain